MSPQSCLFNNNKHLLHWRGVLPYRVPPGGSPRNISSQMWGHRGPLSRESNPGPAGPGIGVSPINLKQNMKPRHFSFVGHCRGQGHDPGSDSDLFQTSLNSNLNSSNSEEIPGNPSCRVSR